MGKYALSKDTEKRLTCEKEDEKPKRE